MKKLVSLTLAAAMTLSAATGTAFAASTPAPEATPEPKIIETSVSEIVPADDESEVESEAEAVEKAREDASKAIKEAMSALEKAQAALESTKTFDPTKIIDWYNESDLWKSVATGRWSNDSKDQITDEELEKIFSMTMKQQHAVGWTNVFFVVIKDAEEQRDAMVASNAANRETFVSDGTVTILVFEDQILTEEQGHVSKYREKNNFYFASPWPYHNAGLSSGLFGLAAASLGYYTHYYAGVSGPNAVADLADGKYKSMSYYVKDEYMRAMGVAYKDGEETPEAALYPVAGNCVLIGAIVVGKPDSTLPIETWATNYARPNNWVIWDAE